MADFAYIARILACHPSETIEAPDHIRAAVAMIIRDGEMGLELLFMERANRDDDPWSGNIGFPGGKVEGGDRDPQQTAERETMEEIGLDLSFCSYLGRLSDIVGSHLPVLVSCYVYGAKVSPTFVSNHEVNDVFWVSLAELLSPERRVTAEFQFAGESFTRTAIRLPQPGKPLLWGITYRLVMEFLQLVGNSTLVSSAS
jgi:8-oxo-dGTP pyrophosphatase MutT (NUDIX family)